MVSRRLHIARDGEPLGKFGIDEIPDLVEAGFLKSDDDYWETGMSGWRPLNELGELRAVGASPESWKRSAQEAVVQATGLLARGTAKLAETTRSLTFESLDRSWESGERLLQDFFPQLTKLAREQVDTKPFLASPTALENEDLMRRAFGALYDDLPPAIARAIPEHQFIEFCLRRRNDLIPSPEAGAQVKTPVQYGFRMTHVRLLATDFGALFKFYSESLGLGVRFQEEGIYAEFDTGPALLSIFHREFMAEAIQHAAPHESALPLQRPVVILSVGDVDAVYVTLKDRGVEFLTAPTDRSHWGVRTAHLTDPDGNLVELNSPIGRH